MSAVSRGWVTATVLLAVVSGGVAWVRVQDVPSVEPAQASDGFTIAFDAGPDANGRPRIDDLPGTSHPVDPPFPTPAHLVGSECTVTVHATNNNSVHPGNDLIVASANSQATLPDVERQGGVHTAASQQVTLGPEVTVTIVLGSGDNDALQTSSVSGTATFACKPPPPETTVPPPTVLSDTTTTGVTTTTVAPTTSSVPPSTTTVAITTTTVPPAVPPPTVAPQSSTPGCPPGTYDTGAGTCLPRAEGG